MANTSTLFQKVTETLEQVAEKLQVELVLIVRNNPTHLRIEASAGRLEKFYKVGAQQRKGSVFEEQHELYCEHLLNKALPYFFVRDSRIDPLWDGNEDEVVFGLINYLGYPIRDAQGKLFGTVCVLDTKPRDYSDEEKAALQRLQQEAENALRFKASRRTTHVPAPQLRAFQPLPTPLTPLKVEAMLTPSTLARKS